MSKIYKHFSNSKSKEFFNNDKYLSRIVKTLYYADLKAAETEDLSLPLTELASEIFSEAQKGKSIDRLHYDTAADLCRYSCISPCSLILAIIYFERLTTLNINYVEKMSCSDLFLITLVVSSKFLWDYGENDEIYMDEWAKSSDKTCKEIVSMEKTFLNAIDWEVYVSEPRFWEKLSEIEMKLAKKQGSNRGHFTYTELQSLLMTIGIGDLIKCLISIWAVLAITYIVGILSISGTILIASRVSSTSLRLKFHNSNTALSIKDNISVNTNIVSDLPKCNKTENDLEMKPNNIKCKSTALNMFSASVFLASIKSNKCFNSSSFNQMEDMANRDDNDSCQYVSWDWWNVPVMTWLTKASQILDDIEMPLIKYYISILETMVLNEKYFYRENRICKATKTRIQDQMENSWHTEWSSSMENTAEYLSVYNLGSYRMTYC